MLFSRIAAVPPVQKFLWNNGGFPVVSALEKSGKLDGFKINHDPTILPIPVPNLSDNAKLKLSSPEPIPTASPGIFYSAADYIAAYKSGKTTPTAVAERFLQVMKDRESELSTLFIYRTPDTELLAAAAESTKRYQNGTARMLEGVPFCLKDEMEVAGTPITMGLSTAQAQARIRVGVSPETTACIQPFLDAGVLNWGKTNMHEIGLDTTGNNPNWGTPVNPYNKGYYTGGSSSGSAAAVGWGLAPIAMGADGGGSIRLPASYNGVYGIKPSHNLVPCGCTQSIAPSVGVLGPIAATAGDLDIALKLCLSAAKPALVAALPPPPKKKLLGIYRPWFEDCDPIYLSTVNTALETLTSKLGYSIIEIPSLPYLAESRSAHALSILRDIGLGFCQNSVTGLTPANRLLISVGRQTDLASYNAAGKLRDLLISHLAALWKKHPGMVIVTPTTPNVGVKIPTGEGQKGDFGVSDANYSIMSMQYVFAANWTGCPSVTLPVGYGEVPMGLMGMAGWGEDEGLVGLGREWEGVWDKRRRGENWIDLLN